MQQPLLIKCTPTETEFNESEVYDTLILTFADLICLILISYLCILSSSNEMHWGFFYPPTILIKQALKIC